MEPADKVAILGPGLLGLSVLQIAKALGASKTYITGRGYRLDIARELGADVAIDVTKEDPVKVVMENTGGRRVVHHEGEIKGGEAAIVNLFFDNGEGQADSLPEFTEDKGNEPA